MLPQETTAAAMLELQQRLKSTLLYLQDEVQPVVETSLNDLFVNVNERVNERVEERLGDSQVSLAFEERLMQFDKAANQVSTTVESIEVMVEKVMIVADEAVVSVAGDDNRVLLQDEQREVLLSKEETTVQQAAVLEEQVRIQEDVAVVAVHEKAIKAEHDILATKEVVLQTKTRALSNFCELVKSLIATKMNQLTSRMVDFMDHLFLAYYEMHLVAQAAETKSTNTLNDLQSKMFDRVQPLLANQIQEKVESEVHLVTETIAAIMVQPEEEQDEEAENLETTVGDKAN